MEVDVITNRPLLARSGGEGLAGAWIAVFTQVKKTLFVCKAAQVQPLGKLAPELAVELLVVHVIIRLDQRIGKVILRVAGGSALDHAYHMWLVITQPDAGAGLC